MRNGGSGWFSVRPLPGSNAGKRTRVGGMNPHGYSILVRLGVETILPNSTRLPHSVTDLFREKYLSTSPSFVVISAEIEISGVDIAAGPGVDEAGP